MKEHVHSLTSLNLSVHPELEAEEWFKTLSIECLGTRLNDISLGEPDLLAAGVQCEHTGKRQQPFVLLFTYELDSCSFFATGIQYGLRFVVYFSDNMVALSLIYTVKKVSC